MLIDERVIWGAIGLAIGLVIGLFLVMIIVGINNNNIRKERKFNFEKDKYFSQKVQADTIMFLIFEFTNNVLSFVKSNLKPKLKLNMTELKEEYFSRSEAGFDALYEISQSIFIYFPNVKYSFRNYFSLAKKLNEQYISFYLNRKKDLDEEELSSINLMMDSLTQKNIKIADAINKEVDRIDIE